MLLHLKVRRVPRVCRHLWYPLVCLVLPNTRFSCDETRYFQRIRIKSSSSIPIHLQNAHDLYLNNQLCPGHTSVHEDKEPFLFGIKAKVPDAIMNQYLTFQKDGDLDQLNNALVGLEKDISDEGISILGIVKFETLSEFKLKRRRSFLLKILNDPMVELLHKVRQYPLEEAVKIVHELENPPAAQFSKEWEQKLDFQLRRAQALLRGRQDYKQWVRQKAKQEEERKQSSLGSNNPSGQIIQSFRVAPTDYKERLLNSSDMVTTTRSVINISKEVDERVAKALSLFKESDIEHFSQYNEAVYAVLEGISSSILLRVIWRCMQTYGEQKFPDSLSFCA